MPLIGCDPRNGAKDLTDSGAYPLEFGDRVAELHDDFVAKLKLDRRIFERIRIHVLVYCNCLL